MKLLALLLLIVGSVYYFYGNELIPGHQRRAQAFISFIGEVDNSTVVDTISANRVSAPIVVFIYKSSCITCRFALNDLIDIGRNNPRALIFTISLDHDVYKLASYLVDKDTPFNPFIYKGEVSNLASALKPFQVTFEEDVPYTVVIDNVGKKEFSYGFSYHDRIDQHLKTFK